MICTNDFNYNFESDICKTCHDFQPETFKACVKVSNSDCCPLCGRKVGTNNYDPDYGCGECVDPEEVYNV